MQDNATEISIPIPPREINKPVGPGAHLRKIRESRHLTLEEMAKRTQLSTARLFQIENDDYQLMGAPAFAKGYLRGYANQLGASKEEILSLLQDFEALHLGDNIRHNRPQLIHEKMDQVTPSTTRWLTYLIIMVLLLGVAGYIWHSRSNAAHALAANTDDAAAKMAETPAPTPDTNNLQTTVPLPPEGGAAPSGLAPEQDTKTGSTSPLDLKEGEGKQSNAASDENAPPVKKSKKVKSMDEDLPALSSTPITRGQAGPAE
jgi:cytoskeletal protein RodZ